MPVAVGSHIGPYEILAPLGEGGMGLVYRARDAKLARDVAIKVLPDVFRDDPDRLARFRREAQTLAALNHPNIAHVYGLEDHAGVHALVLELIEGEDLSALIARGPVPIADVTAIARQIAEGLEAAHELGIVHRDLKPANIMVRSDGTVKILDFGLAKALGAGSSGGISADAMQSPTLTARATAMGIIVGTAAYMAPEQARGRAVDRRADIWAFGLIVYEMLTGTRLFQADSMPETLAHVLSQDISLTTLPPDTPAQLRVLIERCLVRDPRLRLRDIGEARLALSGGPSPSSSQGDGRSPVTPERGRRAGLREVLAWSLAGLLALTAGYIAWTSKPPAADESVLRLGFTLDAPVSMLGLSIALAPDAHAIAVQAPWNSGDRRIYLRRLDGTSFQPLAGTENGERPMWSPDSRSIAFFADDRVKRLDLADGAVRDIGRFEETVHSAAWGDGVLLIAGPAGPLRSAPAAGGAAEPLSLDSAVNEVRQVSPVFLPGGRRFLFTSIRQDGSRRLILASLDDGRRIEIPSPPMAVLWAGEDRLVFTQGAVLYTQRISYDTPAFLGEPQAITPNLDSGWLGVRETVAGPAMLAFVEAADRRRQFTWYPREGGPGRPVGPVGEYLTFDLSRDDRRIVVTQRVANRRNLWLIDAVRGVISPFSSGDTEDTDARWSPDGRSVMFGSTRDSGRSPHRASIGGGPPSRLFSFAGQLFALDDWSMDGRWLLYHEALEGVPKARLIDPHPRDGETKDQEIVLARPLRGTADQVRMSPDGRWVAFNSTESGRSEVIVVPFPPTGEKFQVSREGGAQPVWRRDGRELFFLALDGTLMATAIRPGPAFDATDPQPLFKPRVHPVQSNVEQYAVSADGTRVLVLEPPSDAKPPVVQVITNWMKLLDRSR